MKWTAYRCVLIYAIAAPMSVSDGLAEAQAQLAAGRTDAAMSLLRALVAKDPDTIDSSALLAETLLGEERLDDAGEVLKDALTKHPSSAALLRVLGDLRYRQGKIFDADSAYKTALKADPDNARALYGISRVFETSSLRKKASDVLRVAHALDPHDTRIANSFYASDRRSQTAIARMQSELAKRQESAGDTSDPELTRILRLWIDEAKALDGKPEFEPASAGDSFHLRLTRLMSSEGATGASLPVRINDARGDLRLDTGAGGITLSSRLAERAGIQRLGATEIGGIGNGPSVKAWVGYAARVSVGNVDFKNCLVTVSDRGSVDDSDGLIGSDVFRQFVIRINFRTKTLDLEPLPGPTWDGHTPVDRYDGPELAGYSQLLIIRHYLLVPAMVSRTERSEQTPALVLLDTGSRMNMISTRLASEVAKVHTSDNVRVHGLSGNVKKVYEADKMVFQFAAFRHPMQDLTSFDLSSFSRAAGTEIGGIMGLPLIELFESVSLDYRDGRVKFDYRPQ